MGIISTKEFRTGLKFKNVKITARRKFEPEDIYCTVCQEKPVYACVRCGEIFDSNGVDDIICSSCKEAKKES